jgi:hypothetical protein
VYTVPPADYHAGSLARSTLSSTGARKLLPPSCPALYHHELRNPAPPNDVFDFGHAAHRLVLGAGADLARVDADDWRTKAAKEAAAEARANGLTPLLRADHERVVDMAAALRTHPIASALFSDGLPEQTLIWQDDATGVWCRAMLDWLPHRRPGRRLLIADYKTTASAAPAALARSVANYGYHQQAAFYLDGVRALGLDDDPAFVFVAQEKNPPYLVTTFDLDADALQVGAERNRLALEIFRDCTETGLWPGYTNDVVQISLPPWARRYEEAPS